MEYTDGLYDLTNLKASLIVHYLSDDELDYLKLDAINNDNLFVLQDEQPTISTSAVYDNASAEANALSAIENEFKEVEYIKEDSGNVQSPCYSSEACKSVDAYDSGYESPMSWISQQLSPMSANQHKKHSSSYSSDSPADASAFSDEESSLSKSATRRSYNKKMISNMKACKHIWQFLRDLLIDEIKNQNLITWIDKRRGIFKLLKKDIIAEKWGQDKHSSRKNSSEKPRTNPMPYPYMARGIRYSRNKGYFLDITEEDQKLYGKKLIYRFSQKSRSHCDYLKSFMSPVSE